MRVNQKRANMYHSSPVHTAPETFTERIFTPEAQQMFSIHTKPEKLKTHQSPETLGCALGLRVNHILILTSSFSKSYVLKIPASVLKILRFQVAF